MAKEFHARKSELLESLKGIYQGHIRLLDFMIRSNDDIDLYEEKYEEMKGNAITSIIRMRMHKRDQNHLRLEEFLALSKKDIRKALEILFQEPLMHKDVQFMKSSGRTLPEIYHMSMCYKKHTLISLINNWDIVKLKEDRDNSKGNMLLL